MVFFLAITENTDVMRSRLHPYGCIVIYLHQHGNTCLDMDATVTCKCRVAQVDGNLFSPEMPTLTPTVCTNLNDSIQSVVSSLGCHKVLCKHFSPLNTVILNQWDVCSLFVCFKVKKRSVEVFVVNWPKYNQLVLSTDGDWRTCMPMHRKCICTSYINHSCLSACSFFRGPTLPTLSLSTSRTRQNVIVGFSNYR